MSDPSTQFRHGLPDSPAPAIDIAAPARAEVEPAVRPRLWPGVALVAILWAVVALPERLPGVKGTPLQLAIMFMGAAGVGVAVGLWWLLFSRVHWTDRLLIPLFIGTSGLAAVALADKTFLLMGYGPVVRGMPLAVTAFVLWLVATPGLEWPVRRLGAMVAILLGWGYCDLLRLDGVWGDFETQITYRWVPTGEDAYLADLAKRKEPKAVAEGEKAISLQPGDWPGFRGPGRDSQLKGVRIATDWASRPPRQLWRHRIGPGWSSFTVVGDRIYTQEQRGEKEAVVCFDAATGEERWVHADATRFTEAIGGPGPRSTPTFHDGKLYTLGANGTLNCLDPATGTPKWTRNIVTDSGANIPIWGFSASPLVAQGIVTVFAGGGDGKGVLGYQASSGELAWSAGQGTHSYCSTQLTSVDGTDQLLVVADHGLTSFLPADGKVLWKYEWPTDRPPRVAQPALVGTSDLLVATPLKGMRRLHVTHEGDSWSEGEVWETKDIKPYYNDLVVYKDHIYGFDNNFFTCVGLADGKSTWRARGYGNGQVVLLADQGLLLVSTEKGEVVLVEATPEKHKELGRFKAIEGKTWNHPVLAHGKLFIRNGEEVACFQLAEEGGKAAEGGKKAESGKKAAQKGE
jgi:outer membrane protein assembly factor BamB